MLRPRLVRPRVLLVAVAVVAVALGGCSEPTPGARVPTSSATPATATGSSTPTKLTSEQEVEAAVRAYYAELTRASRTDDTSKLKRLVDKNCPCYGSAQAIDEGAQRREATVGAVWTVREVKVHEVIKDFASAEVKYDVSAYKVLDSKNRVIEEFPSRSRHLDLSLGRRQGGWILTNVFNLEG